MSLVFATHHNFFIKFSPYGSFPPKDTTEFALNPQMANGSSELKNSPLHLPPSKGNPLLDDKLKSPGITASH